MNDSNQNESFSQGGGNVLRTAKAECREKYRAARAALTEETKQTMDRKLAASVVSTMVYKGCRQILMYASKEDEICTTEIAVKALADGKTLFYPRCGENHSMTFYRVRSLEDLKPGTFGVLEPDAGEPYQAMNGDICLVPAMTFDRFGFRLGYGRGFYDRFLSSFTGVTVGLCYSSFLEPNLPKGKYDVKVDVLLTEKGVFPLQKIK